MYETFLVSYIKFEDYTGIDITFCIILASLQICYFWTFVSDCKSQLVSLHREKFVNCISIFVQDSITPHLGSTVHQKLYFSYATDDYTLNN